MYVMCQNSNSKYLVIINIMLAVITLRSVPLTIS